MGKDVNYFFNVDPISIWLTNQKSLDPKLLPLIKMVGEEYDKAKPGTTIRSAHVGMAASNTYLFFTEVLPRAIKKHGGIDRRRAAQGGARGRRARGRHHAGLRRRSSPAKARRSPGRTMRASPVVVQYVDDKAYVVWPKSQAQRDAVLPLPAGTIYSAK